MYIPITIGKILFSTTSRRKISKICDTWIYISPLAASPLCGEISNSFFTSIKDLSIEVDLFTLNFLLYIPYVGPVWQYIALIVAIKYCRTGIHTGTYDRNFRVWSCILELPSYKRETLPLFLFTATHTGQITKNFWEVCLL